MVCISNLGSLLASSCRLVHTAQLESIFATKRANHQSCMARLLPWLLFFTNNEKDGPSIFCTLNQKYNQVGVPLQPFIKINSVEQGL